MGISTEDKDKLMKELSEIMGKDTSRLERLYENLSDKRDKAFSEGWPPNKTYIDKLTSSMDDLKMAIDSQNKVVESFYNEMKELVGTEDSLDPEEIKAILQYRMDYMGKRKELYSTRSLLDAERGKGAEQNLDEVARYSVKILALQKEMDKLGTDLKNKYGEDSFAGKQVGTFTAGDKVYDTKATDDSEGESRRKAIEESIEATERAEAVDLWEINKAEKANNEELRKTNEKWEAIKASVKAVASQVKTGANYWLKYNEQAISDAKRLGIANKEAALAYQEALMENSKTLSRNFGMSAEQAMKMQEAYAKVTGRATLLTRSQMEDIAASSKLMGDETVQSAIKVMDSIGTTSQTTTELLDRNFARAANSGLDTVKASEEFVKNMSLANKLTFRNGVDGISKMTIMSQTIKMNLQEVANVAEKFSTIEGAIEGAAQLQMLGGPVAMFGGNPMQMLQESLADPEALFNRMKDMASTQAVFNRETGEAEIDPLTLAFMKEQEKALGVSAGTLIGSAKQQAKIREIENDWMRYQPSVFQNASPEAKAAIANKAEYDKEKGGWVVKYLDQKGEEQVVDVKDLTEEHLKAITKDNIEPVEDIRGQVRKIAGELVGTKERWNSIVDQWRTSVGQLISPIMKWGDSIISGDWFKGVLKVVTDGGFGTFGALLGYGAYKGVSTWAAPKIARGFKRLLSGGGKGAGGGAGASEAVRAGRNNSGALRTGSIHAVQNGQAPSTPLPRSRPWNQISRVGRWSRIGGAALSVIGGAMVTANEWSNASGRLSSANEAIDNAQASVRYSGVELARRRTAAQNRYSEERAGAIGAGIGTAAGGLAGMAAGAAAGAAIGSFIPIPFVGTLIGAAVGGLGAYLGEKYGRKVGRSMASREDDDVINRHLNEINKGDEEENIRKIVLPIESIDYNVSLIANRMGVVSAAPARGNIYFEAEAKGEITPQFGNPSFSMGPTAEVSNVPQEQPFMASYDNQVSSQVIRASQVYQPSGPLSLTVNGFGWNSGDRRGRSVSGEMVDSDGEEGNANKNAIQIESIERNVSLIASMFGVKPESHTTGRNEQYYAEANGENAVEVAKVVAPVVESVNMAEGKPLIASHVNEVDTHVIRTSQISQPSGPLSLNIGGSIDLNLRGANIGKITSNDFMKMLNENPYVMRELVDMIVKRVEINENGTNNSFDNNPLNTWGHTGYLEQYT